MTIKESNVTINVRDLSKSIAFYESIGFTIKERWGDHYAQMIVPGITIGLHPTKSVNVQDNSGNVSLGFTVDSFPEAKMLLAEKNISTIDRKEEGGQFLHFYDLDGTALYFINPKE